LNKRFVSILLALMLTLAMALPAMADEASTITLQATPGTECINLSWTPAPETSGLSGYYVYRSTQPGSASGTPAHDFWLTTTTFTDRNVEKGVIYYYTVRPVYGTTIGSPSNGVQAMAGISGDPLGCFFLPLVFISTAVLKFGVGLNIIAIPDLSSPVH